MLNKDLTRLLTWMNECLEHECYEKQIMEIQNIEIMPFKQVNMLNFYLSFKEMQSLISSFFRVVNKILPTRHQDKV